jgi:hypothetical protein
MDFSSACLSCTLRSFSLLMWGTDMEIYGLPPLSTVFDFALCNSRESNSHCNQYNLGYCGNAPADGSKGFRGSVLL